MIPISCHKISKKCESKVESILSRALGQRSYTIIGGKKCRSKSRTKWGIKKWRVVQIKCTKNIHQRASPLLHRLASAYIKIPYLINYLQPCPSPYPWAIAVMYMTMYVPIHHASIRSTYQKYPYLYIIYVMKN